MTACPSEHTLMDFAIGSCPDREVVEHHLAECERCRVAVAHLQTATSAPRRQPGVIEKGDSFGRYVVLEFVGEGAMGRVYAAFDPVLDRRVALKLLRPLDDRRESKQRLLREAQALAKVAHPNLVGVHDAGELAGEVFIAMEFVEGETLRAWLKQPRTEGQIVDAFLQAGRGLAAAHAAGLVHRDFKPDNVLVGRDGRVRVSDFGLARATLEPLPEAPSEPLPSTATATGALVGTPAYMSPEQLRGARVDPRSDQFSFAVALVEALTASRPFSRNSADVVRAGFAFSGPRRLRKALTRALDAEPERRFPHLDELLAELTPRQPPIVALAVVATVLLVAILSAALTRAARAPCRTGTDRVATVWTSGRRAELRAHFEGLGDVPAFERAAQTLDTWAAGWADHHREACEATRVHGEQSDQLLALRMACLDRRLVELEGVLGVLLTTDAAGLSRAGDAVTSMTPSSVCANTTALTAPLPRPDQPAAAEAVERVERTLARAQALKDSGRFKEGLPLATSASLEAHTIGWAPLEAEALLLRGELTDGAGEIAAAEPILRDAWTRAHAGRTDRLAVLAAVSLSFVLSELSRMEGAEEWSWQAEALMPRVGQDWELDARLATQQGHLLFARTDFAGAEVRYQRAWEVRRDHQGPEHQKTVTMLANLANARAAQGHFEEALRSLSEVARLLERSLGPAHYKVGQANNAVSEQLIALNRPREALELLSKILPAQEKALDPSSHYLARLYLGRAQALEKLHRYDEALADNAKALEVFERAKMQLMVGVTTNARGAMLCAVGRVAEGRASIASARRLLLEAFGDEHEEVAVTYETEGTCLLDAGRPEEALPLFQTSLAAREKAGGPDDPWCSTSLSGLGRTQLALGHRSLAVPLLERAVTLLTKSKLDDELLETTKRALATR